MLKSIIKSTLVLVACLLVFISFLPMLLSVTQINQFLISCVNNRIAGKLHAQEIRVGWTDGISVKGLQILDPQGREVALFKKISCDVALLSLIHAPAIEGTIQVDSPKISLIDDKNNGHFSVEQIFASESQSHIKSDEQIKSQIQQNAEINPTLPPANKNELILTDLHLSINIQPQGQAKVNLLCQIENKDSDTPEKGSVNLAATAQNFEELEKAYRCALGQTSCPAASVVSLDCHIDKFPLKAAVPFVNMVDPKLAKLLIPAIGDKITAKISHTLHGDDLGLNLLITSPQISAKLKTAIKANSLSIKEEGTLSWQIRPEVLAAIVKTYPESIPMGIQQQKTTTLLATIQPCSGTLGNDGKMPLDISWNLDSPLTLTSPSWNTPLNCQLSGNMTASALQESVDADTKIEVSTGKDITIVQALCSVKSPLATCETTCRISINGPLAAQASRFLQQQNLPLVEFLGKSCTLEATCKINQKDTSGHVTIDSETIKANTAFVVESDHIALSPSTFALTITPEAISALNSNTNANINVNALAPNQKGSLASTIKANFAIKSAQIPFDMAAFTKSMVLDATLSTNPYTITTAAGPVGISDSSMTLAKTKGQNLLVTTNLTADLANTSQHYQELAGKSLVFKSVMPVQFEDTKITLSTTEASVRSDKFLATIEKMNTLIDLQTKEVTGNIALRSNKSTFETSFFARQQEPSVYTSLPAISVLLNGQMHQFPVELLATLAKMPELTALLGQNLSGNWKIGFNNALTPEPLVLVLNSDGFSLKTNLELGKEVVGKDSATIEYQLTPQRFTALQSFLNLAQSEKQKQLLLASTTAIKGHIIGFKLPLEQFVQQDKPFVLAHLLDSLALNATATIGQISLSQKDKKNLSIAPLLFAADLTGKNRLLTFTCASEKTADTTDAQIAVNGTIKNLWNDKEFDINNADIALETKVQNFPLDIFYSITQNEETTDKLIAVLGHTLDANLNGDITDLKEGTFRGSVQSPRLKSELACVLKDSTLTLEKPLTAEYTLTPEAGKVLLKDVNPLLVTAARSDAPIKLHIDSKDFQIPLKPFSYKTMNIRNIKIEPGVLTCKNGGMLSLLVSLLSVRLPSDDVSLWFTPIYVDIKEGVVNCKRADALMANSCHIATWGKIDLVNDKIDMTLGLSGGALSAAFLIPKLDPGYMIQIPIRGTTQSPKIDTMAATAKITALKLQQTPTPTTMIFGSLLEIATNVVEKDAHIPAPTTQPFPWTVKKHKS